MTITVLFFFFFFLLFIALLKLSDAGHDTIVSFLIILICIQAGTNYSIWIKLEYRRSSENRAQQVYNLLNQCVVCQYEYTYYWLWITVWSEVQIGVDAKKNKDTDEWINEKQTWSSCSSFIDCYNLHLSFMYKNKVIDKWKINVTYQLHQMNVF